VSVSGVLHDRASYRFFWQVLERAHATGVALPAEVARYFALPGEPSEELAC
jgi:citrate lyase subunit beta/citryl-CoA lyase